MKKRATRGQEEMVGFALIIIIVAVILLVFIGFSLRNPQKENIESYEIESFIQAFLQYTTDCKDLNNLEYLSIQDLIISCSDNEKCFDGRYTCNVLNSTLIGIIEESWKVKGDRPVKGYELSITQNGIEIIPSLKKGEITESYKGFIQDFFEGGNSIDVLFRAYY